MGLEIKIGREVEGTYVCRVPSNFLRASRHHATLYWHNGIATLEDNSSSNGTFVNGNRITACQLNENDIVWLGGNGIDDKCYRLDLRQIFAICRNADNKPPSPQQPAHSQQPSYSRPNTGIENNYLKGAPPHGDNYSKEFEHVKQTYIDYHKALTKLNKKANTSMQLPRILISTIPALLGVVIMIVSTDMTMRIVAMSAGSVLSGLIGTLTMGRSSSKKEKMQEEIMDLQLKYQKEYKCPKCGKAFNLEMHWKKLQADGKCPYGCGAQYI